MNKSLYNQKIQQKVLEYLKENGYFWDSQKVLAEKIGYCRQSTNLAISTLKRKGLVKSSKSKNLNPMLRMLELTEKGAHEQV